VLRRRELSEVEGNCANHYRKGKKERTKRSKISQSELQVKGKKVEKQKQEINMLPKKNYG
jgi:hypothetical protein